MTNTKIIGRQILFGVHWAALPLRGFPEGRMRVRMRDNQFVKVFVRPPEGGCRSFSVEAKDGAWVPAFENGANRKPLTAAEVLTK